MAAAPERAVVDDLVLVRPGKPRLHQRFARREQHVLLLGAAAIGCALLLLSLWRYRAVPKTEGGPDQFSASRATSVLRRIVPNDEPRPLGSAASARTRQLIIAEVERLGLRAEVQSGFACGWNGRCGNVSNVVAQIQRGTGPAVVLSAHYDSVPAGPGASDDAVGVAVILEAARALITRATGGPIVLLFTDGEEAGLIGAELFASAHPLARNVKAIINLEARGVSGPSILFEATPDNRGLVQTISASLTRPIAQSLFRLIYRATSHGTDLTAFRRHGLQGVNFAFIEGDAYYHTPSDKLSNVSAASVQDQGDMALALASALANGPVPLAQGGEVYFDVLALFLAHWPVRLNWLFAGTCALLLAVGVFRVALLSRCTLRQIAGGLGAALAAVLFGALGAFSLATVLTSTGALQAAWPAGAPAAALIALTLSVLLTVSTTLARQISVEARWCGVWALWLLLSLAVATAAPEASGIFSVPVGCAGITALVCTRWDIQTAGLRRVLILVPFAIAALVGIPLMVLVYSAVAWTQPAAIGAAASLCLVVALPALLLEADKPRNGLLVVSWGIMALCSLSVEFVARRSPGPIPANFVFHEDTTSNTARLLLALPQGGVANSLRRHLGFDNEVEPFPWAPGATMAVYAKAAHAHGTRAPVLSIINDEHIGDGRKVTAELTLPHPSERTELYISKDSGLTRATVQGATVHLDRDTDDYMIGVEGYPSEKLALELEFRDRGPVDILVAQYRHGLPSEFLKLAASRTSNMLQRDFGDAELTTGHVGL